MEKAHDLILKSKKRSYALKKMKSKASKKSKAASAVESPTYEQTIALNRYDAPVLNLPISSLEPNVPAPRIYSSPSHNSEIPVGKVMPQLKMLERPSLSSFGMGGNLGPGFASAIGSAAPSANHVSTSPAVTKFSSDVNNTAALRMLTKNSVNSKNSSKYGATDKLFEDLPIAVQNLANDSKK